VGSGRFASSARLYIDETGPFDGQTPSAVVALLITELLEPWIEAAR
jgi:hypothetical protein